MSEHMRSRREFLRDAGATALVVGAVGTAGAVIEAERPAEASAPTLPADFVPIDPSIFDPSHWPIPHFPSVGDIETYLANKLGIKGWLPSPPDKDPADVTIHTNDPLTITLPGLTGFKLILGQAGMDYSCTIFRSEQAIQINNLPVRLEFDPSIFKPMKKVGSDYVDDTAPGAVVHADFTIAMIKIGLDGSIHFPGAPPTFSLSPAQIGSSGLVIEASGIQAKLGADTTPATDRGLHIASAVVAFKPLAGMVFNATDVHIGNNGFSGTLSTTFASLSMSLLGFGVKLTKFEAIFKQSSLISTDILGQLTIPFFNAPLDVDIGFTLAGDVSITAKGAGPDGATHLTVPHLFDLKLISFKLVEQANGKSKMQLDLKLKPLFTVPVINLTLPELDLGGLILDQDGNVDPEFGVIDQKNAKHFTVAGFDFECDRLGLGIDLLGGKLYLVFKGGITFPAGLPVGVSVDGLKVFFSPAGYDHFELGGIGIDTTIAGVISLKGDLELKGSGFTGTLDLTIVPLKLRIQAALAVQSSPFSAWYVDLKVDLPVGIPLGPTGLAIYGLEGLFAYNYAPNRLPTENWYRGTPANFNDKAVGWYSKAPHNDVRDPNTKWRPEQGSFAFGIGATLGTVVDDGQAVAVQVLMIIAVPGPVVIIEGAANVLSGREDLDHAAFMAVLVIDAENDIFELGIDIDMKLPKPGGEIVEISGSVNAHFDGHHPDRWHLYIGQQPRPLRLGASILQLFRADTYFMIDNDSLRFGAWVGYDASWDFGPVSAAVSAYIEGDTLVSWRPQQVAGSLHLHGGLALSIFGFGFNLSADALFGVNVPNPFYVKARVAIHLGLPWPLPDIDASITLSWEHGTAPTAVNPLQQVALQHPLIATNLPASTAEVGAPPVPVVPVDWRPTIAFSHDMNNEIPPAALPIQGPLGPANPCEQASPASSPVPNLTIPETAWHYALTGMTLEEAPIGGGSFASYAPFWASWLSVPGRGDGGQGTRLLSFYTANPYQYDVNSSDSRLLQWFNNAHSGLSCDSQSNQGGNQQRCVDLRSKDPMICLTEPLGIGGLGFLPLTTICHDMHGVSYTDPLQITLPAPASRASVRAQGDANVDTHGEGSGSGFTLLGRYRGTPSGAPVRATLSGGSWVATIIAPLIDELVVVPYYRSTVSKLAQEPAPGRRHPGLAALRALRRQFATATRLAPTPLVQVCMVDAARQALGTYQAAKAAYTHGLTVTDKQHWAGQGNVFNPNKLYRLTIVTRVDWFKDVADCVAKKAPSTSTTFTKIYFFKTGDGPQEANALVPYIEQRQPKAAAEPPVLPAVSPDASGWTIPANGALTHFRSYDLGIRFRVDWVNAMYTGGHRPLTFELLDLNGKPGLDTQGHPLKDLFVDSPEHLITSEENDWFTRLKSSCDSIDASTMHKDSIYTITGNGPNPLDLVPSMFYQVRLREQGNPNVLYQFSFATSNFHTFAEMVQSYASAPAPGRPWRAPTVKLSAAQLGEMQAKVIAVAGGGGRDVESKSFDDIAALFGYPARTWPPRTEVTVFGRLLLSNLAQGVALLIEMPQPLDWERTGIRLFRRISIGYVPVATTLVRNFDDTRIFLFIPAARPFAKGRYRVNFTYKRDLGPGKPVYSVGGDSSEEAAHIPFTI